MSPQRYTLTDPPSFMPSVAHLLESIRALSPDERAHLRSLLDEMESSVSEADFAEHMKALGLLDRTRSTRSGQDTVSFQPAPTRGKPASDVIIEDRG